MTLGGSLAAFVLLSSGFGWPQDHPDYPLGKVGVPPITEPADPIRLVELQLGFSRDGATVSNIESRLKLTERAFLGAEVRGERLGAFFETQRLALGVTEENGALELEVAYRAPFLLLAVDASKRRDDTWNVVGDGSLRLSSDWEILLRYQHDTDRSRGGPPSLDDFIDTGRLPPLGRPTRELRSGSVGFLYQGDNHLELAADAIVSRERTEAGFDRTRSSLGGTAIWNVSNLELDGRVFFDRTAGRLERTTGLAEVGASYRLTPYLVVIGRTLQEWQPEIDRFLKDYRAGLTFFGRRFRFARSSEFADDVLALAHRANELGYNERRVYDPDQIRALRERLSLSPARAELADSIEALYLAQVEARNVPQLDLEYAHTIDEILGVETDTYRFSLGVPWHVAWPFSRGEDRVEFLRIDWVVRAQKFAFVATEIRSDVLTVAAELDRQNILRFQWEAPGQTPEEVALRIRRPRRFTADYVYVLGR